MHTLNTHAHSHTVAYTLAFALQEAVTTELASEKGQHFQSKSKLALSLKSMLVLGNQVSAHSRNV